ncbi:hypothetical protein [Geopseudomonas aromaticivorans]
MLHPLCDIPDATIIIARSTEIPTAELSGHALNWAVASALGADKVVDYSGSWEHGGFLLDRYNVMYRFENGHAEPLMGYRHGMPGVWYHGPDRLVVACRVAVDAEMGSRVRVPKELI